METILKRQLRMKGLVSYLRVEMTSPLSLVEAFNLRVSSILLQGAFSGNYLAEL